LEPALELAQEPAHAHGDLLWSQLWSQLSGAQEPALCADHPLQHLDDAVHHVWRVQHLDDAPGFSAIRIPKD